MFRLVKLEDRIVLDGAAILDAFEQAQEHDLHAQEVQDHADDAAADDISDDSADHAFDTDEPLYADAPDTDSPDEGGLHVLVISSDIKDGDTLAAAAKDDILVIRYDAETTNLDDLAGLINDALDGEKADSIAFATHNSGAAEVQLTHDSVASLDALANDADQQAFWKNIGGMLDEDGRIDLLACNVAETTDGEHLVAGIENISGAHVAASTDLTGSEAYGGDWVLESGDVDVQETYFDAHRLDSYDGVLVPPTVASPVPDMVKVINVPDVITIPLNTTFTDADGDTLTYSVTKDANASWLSVLPYGNNMYLYGTPTLSGDYYVTLTAMDPAGNTVADDFKITVPPASEHAPDYPTPAALTIAESPGTIIGQTFGPYAATDADDDKLTYSIISGIGSQMARDAFDINTSSGALYVKNASALDYETYKTATPNGMTLALKVQDDSDYTLGDTIFLTIKLTDVVNENPSTVTLNLSATEFSEDGGTLQVNAFNSPADTSGPVTVSLQFPSGGANEASYGADFSGSNVIVIPTGQTAGTPVTLTGIPDTDVEGNETVNIKIGSIVANNAIQATDTYTANLTDVVTVKPAVFLTADNNTFAEQGEFVEITAHLTNQTDVPVTVPLVFGSTNGAEFGTDYKLVTTAGAGTIKQIVIPANTNEYSILVAGITDLDPNDDGETFNVSIGDTGLVGAIKGSLSNLNLTITDATPPVVTLSVSSSTVLEGEQTVITANLSEKATSDATILLDLNGNALNPADFGVYKTDGTTPADMSGTHYKIIIPVGASQGSLVVKTVEDGLFEGATPETVGVTIYNMSNAIAASSGVSPVISIVDKDATGAPEVQLYVNGGFEITSGSFAENGFLDLDLTLTDPVGVSVGVDLKLSDVVGDVYGTFGASDFSISLVSPPPGASASIVGDQIKVTVPPTYNALQLRLTGAQDSIYEGTEVSSISIANVVNANPATTPGANNTSIVATLNDLTAKPTVTLATVGDTLLSESAGESTGLKMTVAAAGGTTIAPDAKLTADLIASGSASFTTGDGDYQILDASGNPVSMNTSGGFTFTLSEGENLFTVKASYDIVVEGNETIILGLGNTALNTAGSASLTIEDDDPGTPFNLGFSTDSSLDGTISEIAPSNTSVLQVQTSIATSGGTDVELNFSSSVAQLGADYTLEVAASSGTLVLSGTATPDTSDDKAVLHLNEGVTAADVTVRAIQDSTFEGSVGETVLVSLNKVTGQGYTLVSPTQATMTIVEDVNAPTVTLNVSNATFAEDTGSVHIYADVDNASTVPITVALNFSTNDADALDYTPSSNEIIISANATRGQTSISGVPDTWLESNETITVHMDVAGANTANNDILVTIVDDDANRPPQIKLELVGAATFGENGGETTYKVIMDRTSSQTINVNLGYTGVASAGTDFTVNPASVSLSTPADQTNGVLVTLTGKNDSLVEGREALMVTATTAGGNAQMASPQNLEFTVVDDDIPYIDLSFGPSEVTEGQTTLLTATIRDGLVLSKDITIPLNFSTDSADHNDIDTGGNIADAAIIITAGATSGSLNILVNDGDDPEEQELMTASVSILVTSADLEPGNSALLTIDDKGDKPELSIALSTNGVSYSPADTIIESDGATPLAYTADLSVSLDTTMVLSRSAGATIYLGGTGLTYDTDGPGTVGTGDYYIMEAGTTNTVVPNGNSFPVVFQPGITEAHYTIVAASDTLKEGDEKLVIRATASTTNIQNTASPLDANGFERVTLTVVDEDYTPPTVGIYLGYALDDLKSSFNETINLSGNPAPGYTNLLVTVTENSLDAGIDIPIMLYSAGDTATFAPKGVTSGDFTVFENLLSSNQSASLGADGVLLVHLDKGVTLASFNLKGINDNIYEGSETFTVFVDTANENLSGISAGGHMMTTGTIIDDDKAPTITLTQYNNSNTAITIGEGNPGVQETASITLNSNQVVGFDTVVTVGVTMGPDYEAGVSTSGAIDATDGDFVVAIEKGLNAPAWSAGTSYDATQILSNQYVKATVGGPDDWYYFRLNDWEDKDGDGLFEASSTVTWNTGALADSTDGELIWVNMGKVYPDFVTSGSGTDITATANIVMPDGEQDLKLIITPVSDTIFESTETVTMFLPTEGNVDINAVGYSAGALTSGPVFKNNLTIVSDDKAPDVTLTIGGNYEAVDGTEGNTLPGAVQITTGQGLDLDVKLGFTLTTGTTFDGAVFGGLEWYEHATEGTDKYDVGDLVYDSVSGDYFKVVASGYTDNTSGVSNPPPWGSHSEGSIFTDGDGTLQWQNMGRYDYALESDTVAINDDYVIRISKGATSAPFNIVLATDTIFENIETNGVVSIESVNGSTIPRVSSTAVTLSIYDDTGAPEIGFDHTSTSMVEGGANGTVYVTMSHEVAADTLVVLSFDTNGAIHGVGTEGDFSSFPTTTLKITAGATSGKITLNARLDNIYEGDENFTMGIASTSSAFVDWDKSGTYDATDALLTMGPAEVIGTVIDGTAKPAVSFVTDTAIVFHEGVGVTESVLKLQISNGVQLGTTIGIDVLLQSAGGVFASYGADYEVGTYTVTDSTMTVTMGPGMSETSITFSGMTDTLFEGSETFGITLVTVGASADYTLGTTANVIGTVLDDAPAPTVGLTLTTFYDGTNGSADPKDTIFLEAMNNIFTAGENTTATLHVTLDGANFAAGNTTGITIPLAFGTEGGALFSGADRDYEINAPVVINSSGMAYVVMTADGVATVTLNALPANGTYEGDESFTVSLSTKGANLPFSMDSAAKSVTPTIWDMETAPVVSLSIATPGPTPDDEMAEDGGTAYVKAVLNATASSPVTVALAFGGVASEGSDYTVNTKTLVIPAGATSSASIPVNSLEDSLYEGNETFGVTISDVTSNNARIATDPSGWTSADYMLGNQIMVTAGDGNYYIYKVTTDNGSSNATIPTFLDGAIGQTVADGDLVWTNVGLADVNDALDWDAGATVSTAGDPVLVTPGNGWYYRAVSDGVTGNLPPTVWPTVVGDTVVDGSVTWVAEGKGTPQADAVLTIIDNDSGPVVSIDTVDFTVGEDSIGNPAFADAVTHGAITVKLSATSAVAETVYLTHEDAGLAYPAEYGTDYGLYYDVAGTAGPSVVTAEDEVIDGGRYLKVEIPAFATGATLHFVSMTDNFFEGDGTPTGGEIAHLAIDHFGNGGVTANTAADDVMVTIVDNDLANARTVGLSYSTDASAFVDSTTGTEMDIPQTITAYALIEGTDGPSTEGASVDMKVTLHVETSGAAIYGTDFVIGSGLDPDGDGIFTVTITTGASWAEVPITILSDDLLEFTEGFGLKLDSVLGGVVSTLNDELTGTIYDNPDTNITIELNPNLGTNTVLPPADAWAAGITVSEGDVLAANGSVYELFYDGIGNTIGSFDLMTTGAIPPVAATAGDHVESGDTGTGLYWQNAGAHEGLIVPFIGSYSVSPGDYFVMTAGDGSSHLVQADTSGGAAIAQAFTVPTIGDNPGDSAIVTFGGGATVSFVNVGAVSVWETGTFYDQDDFVVQGPIDTNGASFMLALDDGTSSAGAFTLPTTLNEISRDGDTNRPMLWEVSGGAVGIVDETDEAMSNVPFFVIKNDNQSENGVIVTWELEAGYTAVAGDGVTAPADYFFTGLSEGATSGQVQLGAQDNASAYIRLTIPGDQFEETSGGTLPIRITGVYEIDPATGSAGASYTTGVTVDTVYNAQAASLTITDTSRDPDISQTTGDMIIPPDASPEHDGISDLAITSGFMEDGVATITMSDLWFTDADHYVPGNTDSAALADPSDIDVVISAGPTAGVLFLDMNSNGVFDSSGDTMLTAGDSFNLLQVSQGMVKYDHTGGDLGQMVDSFTFTVTDGSNITYENETSGTPFTFTFSATPDDDAPAIKQTILFMAEGSTGQVYKDELLGETAGSVVIDPDTAITDMTFSVSVVTGSLADMDDGTADGWAPLTSGSPFNINAAGQLVVEKALDYEERGTHTLHIKAFDGVNTVDSYLYVQVIDQDELLEFDTGIGITDPATPIVRGQDWIFLIEPDVFKTDGIVNVKYEAIPQTGASAGQSTVLNWVWFNQEELSFVYSSLITDDITLLEPTEDMTYTIKVTATYKWGNDEIKDSEYGDPQVVKTFTLEYTTLASLELDMMMDALDYLEQSTDVELPADGEAIEVQEMMMVAQAPADYPAQDASAKADGDHLSEFADVLALLEGEELAQPEDGDIA